MIFPESVKVVLLQPPTEDFYDTDIRLQPIGLGYLKAAIGKYLPEFSVVVRDYHQGWGRSTIAVPPELAYLREFYALPDSSPFSSFHQYYHFGASYAAIAEDVAALNPDIVGISSLFSPYYREALRCAAVIRQKCPRAVIIAGGSHVSCAPETMLADPNIDFIIQGEGERPLVEFLKAWRAGKGYEQVPNLGYMRDGKAVLNPRAANFSLAELPPPDLSDLPMERYLYHRQPISMIITSRGCPHRCSFCSVQRTFGLRYRRRRPESVVQEMEERYAAGYRVLDFEDDNLTFDRNNALSLLRLIRDTFQGRKIELLAMNGISYRSLDAEILTLMRQAGFTHLNLALVSADEHVLAAAARPHRVDNFAEVVKAARAMDLQILAHQILGLPGEKLASMLTTLALLAREPVLIGVSIFYLTPGAPIAATFPEMSQTDIIRARSTAMAVVSPQCSRTDLFTLFVTARIINFLKGLDVAGDEVSLAELSSAGSKNPKTTGEGFILLSRLLAEGRLYAVTRKGHQPVKHFDEHLFFRLWHNLDRIRTQRGGWIRLHT